MKTFTEFSQSERGLALPLVLVLLLIGGLIITPLLSYMSTGLIAGESSEQHMQRLYAADAGVEDAIRRIQWDDSLPQSVGDTETFSITNGVNNKDVTYVIEMEDDAAGLGSTILQDAIGYNPKLNFDPSSGHNEWFEVTDNMTSGTYTVTFAYSENASANQKWLRIIAVWFEGENYDIDVGSVNGDFVNQDGDPVIYPTPTVWRFGGGTTFIWEWKQKKDQPYLEKQPGGDSGFISFDYIPTDIPGLYFPWAVSSSNDVGTIGEVLTFGQYKVTSTAIDNNTGQQTQVISYVANMGLVSPTRAIVLTWQVSP